MVKEIQQEEANYEFDGQGFEELSFKRAGFGKQLKLLCGRTYKGFIWNPRILRTRIIQTIIMTILVMSLFFQLDDDEKGIGSKEGLIMFLSIQQVSGGLQSTLYPFIMERPVFLREYANKAYSPFPYFLSKTIIETPLQVLLPMALSIVCYWTTGLDHSPEQFLIFMLVLCMGTGCGTSMGFFIGCLFDSLSAALTLTNLFTILPIIFNGMVRSFDDLPIYLRWISYISVYRYECESLIYNEF